MFFTLKMPKNIPVEEHSAAWGIKIGLAFTLGFFRSSGFSSWIP